MSYLKNILQRSFSYQSSIVPGSAPVFRPERLNIDKSMMGQSSAENEQPGTRMDDSNLSGGENNAPNIFNNVPEVFDSRYGGDSRKTNDLSPVFDNHNNINENPGMPTQYDNRGENNSWRNVLPVSTSLSTGKDQFPRQQEVRDITKKEKYLKPERDSGYKKSGLLVQSGDVKNVEGAAQFNENQSGHKSPWIVDKNIDHNAITNNSYSTMNSNHISHNAINDYRVGAATVEKTVNITIGRIEVKAGNKVPPPTISTQSNKTSSMSLSDYLTKRNSGER